MPVDGHYRCGLRSVIGLSPTSSGSRWRIAMTQKWEDSKPFEPPYGWAWLLKLAEELHGWEDSDAKTWSRNLRPLAEVIVARYLAFFPKQTYPIRTGVHPNTAFGLFYRSGRRAVHCSA